MNVWSKEAYAAIITCVYQQQNINMVMSVISSHNRKIVTTLEWLMCFLGSFIVLYRILCETIQKYLHLFTKYVSSWTLTILILYMYVWCNLKKPARQFCFGWANCYAWKLPSNGRLQFTKHELGNMIGLVCVNVWGIQDGRCVMHNETLF